MDSKSNVKKRSGLTGDKTYVLTKSKYVTGLRCAKHLYLEAHSPELKEPDAPGTILRKENGIMIGELVHSLYPGGVLIERNEEKPAVPATQAAMEAGALTIFEATFEHEQVLVRVDILHRQDIQSPWELIEVKSSTKVKDEHYPDLAVQVWVLRECGVPLAGSFLMHIDNGVRYPHLEGLMKKSEDLSEDLKPYISEVPRRVAEMKGILEKNTRPESKIGQHCESPWGCPFKDVCWKDVADRTVLNLYMQDKEDRFKLYHSGAKELTDPRIEATDPIGQRMIEVEKTGRPYFDADAVKKELKTWGKTLYFLDFETMAPPIPRFENVRPYQAVPMQYCLVYQEGDGKEGKIFDYLHDDASDPRPKIAEEICKAIGAKGKILAFNASYEKSILKQLANVVPELAPQLLSIEKRTFDAQQIFRDAIYYSGFNGTFSLKTVAPTLLGEKFDYKLLDISEGVSVEYFFNEFIHADTVPERKAELRRQMIEYCRVDSVAVMELINWLRQQVTKKK